MISGLYMHATVGSVQAVRCPHMRIATRRHFPVSRASVTLPDPDGRLFRTLKKGDSVRLVFGYRGQAHGTWQGVVSQAGAAGKDQIQVRAAGVEYPVASVPVTQSWQNEDPAAIIRFAARAAGITIGRIDSPKVSFPRFVASGATVWQIARQCENTCRHGFGLDMSRWALWMGADGLNWGDFDEPGNLPVVATGAGLITHLPAAGPYAMGRVETFLNPGLNASMQFRLMDTRRGVNAAFRAQAVTHDITPAAARTHIGYGMEHERM
jgi:hypothetical protein